MFPEGFVNASTLPKASVIGLDAPVESVRLKNSCGAHRGLSMLLVLLLLLVMLLMVLLVVLLVVMLIILC